MVSAKLSPASLIFLESISRHVNRGDSVDTILGFSKSCQSLLSKTNSHGISLVICPTPSTQEWDLLRPDDHQLGGVG